MAGILLLSILLLWKKIIQKDQKRLKHNIWPNDSRVLPRGVYKNLMLKDITSCALKIQKVLYSFYFCLMLYCNGFDLRLTFVSFILKTNIVELKVNEVVNMWSDKTFKDFL